MQAVLHVLVFGDPPDESHSGGHLPAPDHAAGQEAGAPVRDIQCQSGGPEERVRGQSGHGARDLGRPGPRVLTAEGPDGGCHQELEVREGIRIPEIDQKLVHSTEILSSPRGAKARLPLPPCPACNNILGQAADQGFRRA